MVYREQTVNVGQSGGVVQMKFGDVALEMSYRQAEAIAQQLAEHSRDGRRANPPVITKGCRVRCLYRGRSYGQIGTVLSCDGDRIAVGYASNIVGGGYKPYELELVDDSE